MDLKTLIEANWKGIVAKFKLKDNGVQRCLANYAKLEDDQHSEQTENQPDLSLCQEQGATFWPTPSLTRAGLLRISF